MKGESGCKLFIQKYLLILSRLAATSNVQIFSTIYERLRKMYEFHSSLIGLVAPNVVDSETIK